MALDASMFILYVFLYLIFSFLLFTIVLCCKFAIFEDDEQKSQSRRKREETNPTETSQILSKANYVNVYKK
jgi:hypothetical protein